MDGPKASYISARNKSRLYCDLSHLQLLNSLFQDNDLSYSRPIQPVITVKITDTTQGEMSDRSSQTTFRGFKNLQNTKNHFIEAKTDKNIRTSDTTWNYLSTSAWLRYASSMKRDKCHFYFCNLSK